MLVGDDAGPSAPRSGLRPYQDRVVERAALIEHGFAPDAVRIGLTATPDYDEYRALCRFFPTLIHEMTLEQALELELLAPLRVWVAEVDAAGSEVRIVGGDFEEESLGRVMSAAPLFQAVAVFRYRGANARKAALVACASRQQARDLHTFLQRHRPPGSPQPEIILGETPRDERERLLSDCRSDARIRAAIV